MKNTSKQKQNADGQLLSLLKKVLPKAVSDPKLMGKIYDAIEAELQAKAKASAFDKFCTHCELPDLEPASIQQVQQQFAEAFAGADVTVKPNKKEKSLAVEVALPEGGQFSGQITVKPKAEGGEEEEFTPKFVPFPVSLPGDPELAWLLGKQETMTPEEAGIALAKVEDDFWGSKAGQKLLRDRVERCFPEFIARVPSGLLKEVGLKRHYKMPEPVKVLKVLGPK